MIGNGRTMRNVITSLLLLLTCGVLGTARVALAHVGPPFPIVVERPMAGYRVTVWTDPDVGEAVFYVVLESETPPKTGDAPKVDLWVQPATERLPKVVYPATRQDMRDVLQFVAKPEFDAAEMWTVGVDLHLPDGKTEQLVTQVEATPPGLGPWDLAIYLAPFLLFGGLWGYAFIRRSREAAARCASQATMADGSSRAIPAAALHHRQANSGSS